MMVGNSVKSDVLPMIEAGGWGVHVPHDLAWALDHADPPQAHARFRTLVELGRTCPNWSATLTDDHRIWGQPAVCAGQILPMADCLRNLRKAFEVKGLFGRSSACANLAVESSIAPPKNRGIRGR